jgi:hypothetical protein
MRRQLVLTWVAGLVASATMALVGVALFLLPATSKAWVISTAVVGSVAVAAVLFVLLRHVVTLAGVAFRREPS